MESDLRPTRSELRSTPSECADDLESHGRLNRALPVALITEAAPRTVPLRGKLPDFSILNEIARLDGALTRELGGLISAHA